MTKRITKREYFEAILAYAKPEHIGFIEHELELLAAKAGKASGGTRKPTKAQVANAELGAKILAGLEPEKGYTVTEVIQTVPAAEGLSTQKVTPILAKLVEAGSLVAVEVKGRKVYQLV